MSLPFLVSHGEDLHMRREDEMANLIKLVGKNTIGPYIDRIRQRYRRPKRVYTQNGINVFIVFEDRRITRQFSVLDDVSVIYDVVDKLNIHHFIVDQNGGYFLSFNGKPLRKGFTLRDMGITINSTITVQFRLKGGDMKIISPNNLIFTNHILDECEQEILGDRSDRLSQLFKKYGHRYDQSEEIYDGRHRDTIIFNEVCRVQGLEIATVFNNVGGELTKYLKLNKCDFLIKLLEDVFILAYYMINARKHSERVLAVVNFVKQRTDGPLLRSKYVTDLLEYLENVFSGYKLQSCEQTFVDVRSYLNKYEEVKHSPVFEKFYKFTMFALSLSLFDKIGLTMNNLRYTKLEQEALRKKYYLGPDFIHSLLDTLLFLCERGYQCMKTGTMDPIYHCGSKYEKWFNEAIKLKRNAQFLTNPEPHGIDRFSYLADLNEQIEAGNAIYKHASRIGDNERKVVRSMLAELELIKSTELTKRAAQKDRKAPFSVLIYGASSVAKSTFTKILYYHYGKLFNLPIDAEFKYTRNPVDPYWVNFNSTQWCVQLDDIAFMHPNKAMNGDPSLMEMLQVVNNVPFVPTQADLADKGRTPVRSRFVIATTNTMDLNAFAYFSCPLAVQRRLPFIIDIQPKAEYIKDNVMLDGHKVPEVIDGDYPDYWTITVKRIVPSGVERQHQRAQFEDVTSFDNIYDFVAWFSREAKQYEILQEKTMNCDDTMSRIELCENCFVPKNHCQCKLQVSQETYALEFLKKRAKLLKDRFKDDPINEPVSCVIGFWNWIMNFVIWLFIVSYFSSNICKSMCKLILGKYFMYHLLFDLTWDASNIKVFYNCMGNHVERKIGRYSILVKTAFCITSSLMLYKGFKYLSKLIFSHNDDQKYISEDEHVNRAQAWYDDGYHAGLVSSETSDNCVCCESEENMPIQGNVSAQIGTAPKPDIVERNNVWYKNDYQTTTFDVNPMNTSYLSIGYEKTKDILIKNCVNMRVTYVSDNTGERMYRYNKAICVAGHIYMVNNHLFPDNMEECELRLVSCSEKDGINSNITFMLHKSCIRRFPNRDIAFVNIQNVPPRKNIINLFGKKTLNGVFKGDYIAKDRDGSRYENRVDAIRSILNMHVKELDVVMNTFCGTSARSTREGDCGSVLLANTQFGPIILGLHIMGESNAVVAIRVDDEFVKIGIEAFDEIIISSDVPLLSSPSVERNVVDLHKKSPVRYSIQGSANVYGSFTGFRRKSKSSVKNTLICDSMLSRGYVIKHGPPVMNTWEPWSIALKDMVNPVNQIDVGLLSECTEAFSNDILNGLTEEDLNKVHVYDDLTTINGAPGVAYVDKINRNTSAGNPWKRSKKYFMKAVDPIGNIMDPVLINDEIMDRVGVCIEKYKSGQRYMPNFCAHLKDEATSYKKIASKKTRVFTGAPLDWTIVVRKYLLSTVRLIQNKRFLFEAAPGTIAQSTEWGKIREYLTQFGEDQIVAGDYAKFDKRMPPTVILAAFRVLMSICKTAGYTKEDLSIVQGIAEDTAFPLVDFDGDLIEFFGSNPSGHALTVIINSIANSLYMRYSFGKLGKKWGYTVAQFKLFVALITYGDDNAMGISKNISHWFNHTTIQNSLKEIGIEYTMADKEQESIPLIHIDDVSFLKRKWRWDKDVKAYLCPLEHDSIEKMLTTCVTSKTVTEEEQCVSIITTAVREYFWYGREIFLEKRNMLMSVVEENNLRAYVQKSTFPTWKDLYDEFWNASSNVI